jgi:hypothetical protein
MTDINSIRLSSCNLLFPTTTFKGIFLEREIVADFYMTPSYFHFFFRGDYLPFQEGMALYLNKLEK